MNLDRENILPFLVGVGILSPMFFTLSGGVYRNRDTMYDSGGVVTGLPLPLSILVCLIALIFLFTRLRAARLAWAMITGTVVVLVTSLWLGSDGVTAVDRKLITMVQILLPMMGLLVGQLLQNKNNVVAKSFLAVLLVLIPMQLIATWYQHVDLLADYLYLFTIYSHIQYVTLILVCAFAYTLNSLWDEYKPWLVILMSLTLIYVGRSHSLLTMAAYGLTVLGFILWKLKVQRKNARHILLAVIIITMAAFGMAKYILEGGGQDGLILGNFSPAFSKIKPILEGKVPKNVQERFGDWELFGAAIAESNKTLLVGHPQPMPREIRTSPHNWYIDVTYTFGIIALLPMLSLIGYTVNLCWKARKKISAQTWWLAGIVFYLVVIDSNFKVTLRQPYPGIFAFFMWGMLLTRLNALKMVRPA